MFSTKRDPLQASSLPLTSNGRGVESRPPLLNSLAGYFFEGIWSRFLKLSQLTVEFSQIGECSMGTRKQLFREV